tara:strand:- start:16681 stop:17142 length:462 start_codon:yes stop_codon:yes gene_type:complete
MILVNTSNQKIYLFKSNELIFESDISTSLYGLGCQINSNKTPTGLHIVASMLGRKLPAGTLFKNRIPTSKIIKHIPKDNQDYITSRIIRLSGLEDGINKGGDVDTFDRYIYIHGTPHIDKLGTPESHGCIRMSDNNVIKLFDLISYKELVLID